MYLIVGNFISESVYLTRKLPSRNPASNKRMLDIASSINSNNQHCLILSSASALKIGFDKKLFISSKDEFINGINIKYSNALAIPYLSQIWEFFSMLFSFIKIIRNNQIKVVICYCYYPSIVLIALVGKILRLKIIEELEDVVLKPDQLKITQFNFFEKMHHYIGNYLMNIIITISDVIIIPTNKFLNKIPANKKILKITGCVTHAKYSPPVFNNKIVIFFSGLLNLENGFQLLIDTLELLELNETLSSKYEIWITGYNPECPSPDFHYKYNKIKVFYFGFLPNNEYEDLLKKAHICLVLTKPNSLFSNLKTPSKAIEFMSYGKCMIISDIGDFKEFNDNLFIMLYDYSSHGLLNILINLNHNQISKISKNAYDYSFSNWDLKLVGNQIINL